MCWRDKIGIKGQDKRSGTGEEESSAKNPTYCWYRKKGGEKETSEQEQRKVRPEMRKDGKEGSGGLGQRGHRLTPEIRASSSLKNPQPLSNCSVRAGLHHAGQTPAGEAVGEPARDRVPLPGGRKGREEELKNQSPMNLTWKSRVRAGDPPMQGKLKASRGKGRSEPAPQQDTALYSSFHS